MPPEKRTTQSSLHGGQGDKGPLAGLVNPRCRRCELHRSRTMVVPGRGNPRAKICLVGEAPGKKEDLGGEPFIGRAGSLLDGTLEGLGLDRARLFITNTVKCRPPGNRNPTRAEVGSCERYLDAELKAVNPRLVCVMGMVPARWALDRADVRFKNLSEVVGERYRIRMGGKDRTLIVNYHPAACVYNRRLKPEFERVMSDVASLAGGR